jgi:uncharacterized integral membrane protein
LGSNFGLNIFAGNGVRAMPVYLIVALLFFSAIAVFVFQNPSQVTVHFLSWVSPDVSLAVVALISACVGAIITFLVDSFRMFKVGRNLKELQSANRKLQAELKSLKGEKSGRSKGLKNSPSEQKETAPRDDVPAAGTAPEEKKE